MTFGYAPAPRLYGCPVPKFIQKGGPRFPVRPIPEGAEVPVSVEIVFCKKPVGHRGRHKY